MITGSRHEATTRSPATSSERTRPGIRPSHPTARLANTGSGVVISGAARHHITISTSVISNNGAAGRLHLRSGHGIQAANRRTGSAPTPAELTPSRNGGDGVVVTSLASFNTIGGTSIAARDIISGNGGGRHRIFGRQRQRGSRATTSDSNATGTVRVRNGTNGVSVLGLDQRHRRRHRRRCRRCDLGQHYNGVAITAGSTGILVAGDLIGTDAERRSTHSCNNVGRADRRWRQEQHHRRHHGRGPRRHLGQLRASAS